MQNTALEYHEILKTEEELHPDLIPYLEKSKIGSLLRHPLVYSVPHTEQLNAYINRYYEQKLRSIDQFEEERLYENIIWLYERPYRLIAFELFKNKFTPAQYWEYLGKIWTDSENIYQDLELWKSNFTIDIPEKHLLMSEEDQEEFDKLPEKLTLYRGYIPKFQNKRGLSYTLSFDKAKWFADRFKNQGRVLSLKNVKKTDVIAYINSRDEQEIIYLRK